MVKYAKWGVILSVMIILAVGMTYFLLRPSPTVFETVRGTGPLTWCDGPQVELSVDRVSKLNRELSSLIDKQAPGQRLSCKVTANGVARVDITWSANFPEALQGQLTAYISDRVLKLAQEQQSLTEATAPH